MTDEVALQVGNARFDLVEVSTAHKLPGPTRPFALWLPASEVIRIAQPCLDELAHDLRTYGEIDEPSEHRWMHLGLPAGEQLWREVPALLAGLLEETLLIQFVLDALVLERHGGTQPEVWL